MGVVTEYCFLLDLTPRPPPSKAQSHNPAGMAGPSTRYPACKFHRNRIQLYRLSYQRIRAQPGHVTHHSVVCCGRVRNSHAITSKHRSNHHGSRTPGVSGVTYPGCTRIFPQLGPTSSDHTGTSGKAAHTQPHMHARSRLCT